MNRPNRPRVTASHYIESTTVSRLCDDGGHTTPGVLLDVEFDLHDHAAALAALDRAVASVRAQVAEVTKGADV